MLANGIVLIVSVAASSVDVASNNDTFWLPLGSVSSTCDASREGGTYVVMGTRVVVNSLDGCATVGSVHIAAPSGGNTPNFPRLSVRGADARWG